MDFKVLPGPFSLSTFKSPLIAFVTIIAYLNMIFFQINSAVAMEDIGNGGHRHRVVKLTTNEEFRFQETLASYAKPKAVNPATKQTSLFSSSMSSVGDWINKGKSVASSVASTLSSAFVMSPREAQFLLYVANASTSAVFSNPDFAEPLLVFWGSYMASKVAKSGFQVASQFAKKQYKRWFGHSSVEEESLKSKRSPIQLDPETARTIVKVLTLAELLLVPAAAISATNLFQELNYTTDGPPVFFNRIKISDAKEDFCQFYSSLANPSSGKIHSTGNSTAIPVEGDGLWIVSGKCSEQVQPLVNLLAYYAAKNFNSFVSIFVSVSDDLGYVTGQININNIIPPPPTLEPTMGPTTFVPTVGPTTSQPTAGPTTFVPTTSQPTMGPTTFVPTTYQPTMGPTTFVPTVGPTTSQPTAGPTTFVPTTSQPTMGPTTFVPTTYQPTMGPTTFVPTTSQPTMGPTTFVPTTSQPIVPTVPTTLMPTVEPTTWVPTTSQPIVPTTWVPTTPQPTVPTTLMPTMQPTTSQPSVPTTLMPTVEPTTWMPTVQPTMIPTSSFDPTPVIITTIILGVFVVLGCVWYICFWKKKKKKESNESDEQGQAKDESTPLTEIKIYKS